MRSARPFFLTAWEPAEHELQIDCTAMLRILLLPDVQWTAVDHAHTLNETKGRNGRPIGLMEAVKRQRRGIKPGIFDYLLWHRGKSFAIELKVDNNDLSPDQEDFGKGLIAAQVEIKVCWTKDQVHRTVVDWGLTRVAREVA